MLLLACCNKGFSRYIQEYFIKTAGQLVVQDLRNDLYDHTLDLSMGFFSKSPVGNIISRILNDIGMLQKSAADELVAVVREGLTLIGLIGLLFYNDWRLALVAFTVLPIALIPATQIGRRIKKYVRKSLANISVLTSILQESFSGIKVVKAFGAESAEQDKFHKENWNYYLRMKKVIRYDSATAPIMELLSSRAPAGVYWYIIHRMMHVDNHQEAIDAIYGSHGDDVRSHERTKLYQQSIQKQMISLLCTTVTQ